MNKTYKYTFLTLFLTLVFVFGSMTGMNLILRIRERQLLTESGRTVVEIPVRAWEEDDNGGEKDEDSDMEKYTLTTGQMADVITCWNERMGVTTHNPVIGQISMEEAINKGQKWMVEMEMGEMGKKEDAEKYSINATLGIAAQKNSERAQLEPYYSFWTVQFSGRSMRAVLYLNAVTGKILSAEIILYENLPETIPYEKLNRFVELSGLQTSDAEAVINKTETQAILQIDDSQLLAKMDFQYLQTGYPLSYGENGLFDYGEETFYKKKAIIVYKLTVN